MKTVIVSLVALCCTPSLNPAAAQGVQTNVVIAAKTAPFTNSLGMPFVPVPGTAVRFCIWETRVRDYRQFCEAAGHEYSRPDFEQTSQDPAANVNWEDAQAFCRWLTAKEKNEGLLHAKEKYRLPTDAEWSLAVGLAAEQGSTPEKKLKDLVVWPWGYYWPPLPNDGNYGPVLKVDTFGETAPAGSFKPNRFGLYDLGGNVWEWCEDWFNEAGVTKSLRGGSFNDSAPGYLLAAYRFSGTMNLSNDDIGFRVVLEAGPVK